MRSSALLLACLTSSLVACGSSSTPGSTCKNPIGTSEAQSPDTVQHFANQRVGTVVTFDVPANTASITVVEQAVSAPDSITYQAAGQSAQTLENTAVPYFVRDPSGTKIYDDNPSTPVSSLPPNDIANLTAFFATSAPATGTLTIPNTSGGLRLVTSGLTPGKWQLEVSDYAYECSPAFQQAPGASCSGGSDASTYDVTVITKPLAGAGGIPASGTLDVVVYFATTIATSTSLAPLSAATANAGADPDLKRMEQTLKSLLHDNGGITVRSVTYVDLPADVQAKYQTGIDVDKTGGCSPIADLFRFGVGGNTLNIFFVSSFTASNLPSGNSVVGLDGTIPGPATVGGSAGSGAAVATHDLRDDRRCGNAPDYYNCGPDTTAYIIAHEAGHFLGLYHVTESDGTQFDPLLDTPMCPCATCASNPSTCAQSASSSSSNPYQMTISDCTKAATNPDGTLMCGGGANLMFWRLESGSVGTLSAEQQQVIRANPLIQ